MQGDILWKSLTFYLIIQIRMKLFLSKEYTFFCLLQNVCFLFNVFTRAFLLHSPPPQGTQTGLQKFPKKNAI